MSSKNDLHILMYPHPSPGHIIPLLDLTRKLLARDITITVAITSKNVPLLDPIISASRSSSIQVLVLADVDPSVHGAAPQQRLAATMRGLYDLHYPRLLEWFESHASPPHLIVSDFFLGWTHKLACQVGIRRVVFSPSGAFGLSIVSSLWREFKSSDGVLDKSWDKNEIVSFPNLPNSPSYPWWQMPNFYKEFKKGDPNWEFHRESLMGNLDSWGFVFNTFAELEKVYLDHMKKHLGHDRVWAIGPLLSKDDASARGGSSSKPVHQVITWLDNCPNESVVYICFGSRVMLTHDQMSQLTIGLEQCHVRFILCVREPKEGQIGDNHGIIPQGFEDRVGERGLVIKGWAPQLMILKHRAIGAFLTHCGWNSTSEGLEAGVVMLTWPMGADQFTNAKLLVDEMCVGIRVGEGTERIPRGQEIARILNEALDANRIERTRVKEISAAARSAVEKGGSSDKNLEDFIEKSNAIRTSF